MRVISIHHPGKVVIGPNCMGQLASDILATGFKRLFIITLPAIKIQIAPLLQELNEYGIDVHLHDHLPGEPTFNDFRQILNEAAAFKAQSIAGIGGGSVMDVAKIVAALLHSDQQLTDVVGIGLLKSRKTHLICAPTTSGTGSEMSPNSILLNEADHAKLGIISPYLVPDLVYIDPVLTLGLPSAVTAYTGIDALTHCIEAFCNKNAHPVVDGYALEGIRLIGGSLLKAVENGNDLDARTDLTIGSMYGGMCLGPVNTAAVHALAYPLGSYYKMAHGLSNALMLPYVLEYNLDADYHRHAIMALALGAEKGRNDEETARNGIELIKQLISRCNIPSRLSQEGVKKEDIDMLAASAFKVQRLLKNNLKELSVDDIRAIYLKSY